MNELGYTKFQKKPIKYNSLGVFRRCLNE